MAGDTKASKKQKKHAPAAAKLKGTASSNNQPPPSAVSGISSPSKTQQLRQSLSNTQVAPPPASAKKFKDEDYYAALEEQSSSEFVGIVDEPREKRLQKLPDAKRKHHKSSKKDGSRGGVDENEDYLAYQTNVIERSRAYPRDANALGGVSADATHPYIVGDFSPAQIQHSNIDREKIRPGVRPVPVDLDNPNAVFADYHRHQMLQQPAEKKRFSKLRRNKKQKQTEKDEAIIMAERRFPQPPRVGSETFKFFRRVYANIWRLQISDEEIRTPRRIVNKTSSLYAPQSDDVDDGFDDYIDDDKSSQAISPGKATYWSHSSADDLISQDAPATTASSRKPSRNTRQKQPKDTRRPSSRQREKELMKQQKKLQKKQKYRLSDEGTAGAAGEPAATTTDEDDKTAPYDRNQRSSSYDPDRLSVEQHQWRTSDEPLDAEEQVEPSPSSALTRQKTQKSTKPDSNAKIKPATTTKTTPVSTPVSDRLTVEDDDGGERRGSSSRLSVRGRLSSLKQKRSSSKDLRKQRKQEKLRQKQEDDRNSMRLSESQQQFAAALAADEDDHRAPSEVGDEQTRASDFSTREQLDKSKKPQSKAETRTSSTKPPKEKKRSSSRQREKSKQRPPVSSKFTEQLAGVPDRAAISARPGAAAPSRPSQRPSQRPSDERNLIDFDEVAQQARKRGGSPSTTPQQPQKRTQPVGPRSSAPWQKPLTEQQQQQRNIPPPERRSQGPSYLSTASPPRQSVSDQFYSAIETSEQPTNLITTAQLSQSQPLTEVAQKKLVQQQPTLFRTAPPPYQTRRSIADTGGLPGRGSVREASFGGEDDELLLLPYDDGQVAGDEDYADSSEKVPVPTQKKVSSQGTSPVPKKERKQILRQQSRDAKRSASQQKRAEKEKRKQDQSKAKSSPTDKREDDDEDELEDGKKRVSDRQAAEGLEDGDEDDGQKRRSSRFSVRERVSGIKEKRSRSRDQRQQQKQQQKQQKLERRLSAEPVDDDQESGAEKRRSSRFSTRESDVKEKRSKSRDQRQQQQQQKRQQKLDKSKAAAQAKTDKRSKKSAATEDDDGNVLLGMTADDAEGTDGLTAEETDADGEEPQRSSRTSMRGRLSDTKQKRSRSREAKHQRKQQKKTETPVPPKSAESKESRKLLQQKLQQRENAPVRITVEDETSSSPTDNVLITIVNRRAGDDDQDQPAAEDDENDTRRSSRLSMRGLKEHRSQSKERKKQDQKRLGKDAKKAAEPSGSAKNAKKQQQAADGEVRARDSTLEDYDDMLTTEEDGDEGHHRSSRLSMRGLKEQRSRSKQRKKEKKDQKLSEKAAKSSSKSRKQQPADEESMVGDNASLDTIRDATEDEHGSRLTAELGDDEKRRSSRLSMRGLKEARSKSRQRKEKQHEQKQAEKAAKKQTSGKTKKQPRAADDDAAPSESTLTATDDRDSDVERLTAEDVDQDGNRRSSRLSVRSLREHRSKSKQRKKEKQEQKRHEKETKPDKADGRSGRKHKPAADDTIPDEILDSAAVSASSRLTAEEADENGKRRSSRLSVRSSRSKQRKLDKQQQKKQQKLDANGKPLKTTDSKRKMQHREAASAASRESLASAQEDGQEMFSTAPTSKHRESGRLSIRQRLSRSRSHDHDDDDKSKRTKSRGRDAKQRKPVRPSDEPDEEYTTAPTSPDPKARKKADQEDVLIVDVEPTSASKRRALTTPQQQQQQSSGSYDDEPAAKPKKKPLGRLASTLLGRKGSKQISGGSAIPADSPTSEPEAKSQQRDKKAKQKDKKRSSSKNDQKTQASLVSITPSYNNGIDSPPVDATDDQFMISEEQQPYYDARGSSVVVKPAHAHGKHKVISRILHPKSHQRLSSTTPPATTSPPPKRDDGAKHNRPQQKPPKIVLRGQDGVEAGPPAYHTFGGDTLTTEDDDGQQRRSSRFSLRDRFSSSKDKGAKSKQKLPREKKSKDGKKRQPQPSTDETSDSPLAHMTGGVDGENTADGRLTAEDTTADEHRRSSRFSIRGRKEQRSRSKQRKQEERQQKRAEDQKAADGKRKQLGMEESENVLAGMATGDRSRTPMEATDENGNRLNTATDDDSPRRSSRFSIRGRISGRRDKRSKPERVKKSEQGLTDGEEPIGKTSASKRRKAQRKVDKPSNEDKALIELGGTEVDESAVDDGGRLTTTEEDDGKRRSSRFSVHGMKDHRSQSKQRKRQEKLDKQQKAVTGTKSGEKVSKSVKPTHLSVEEDDYVLLGARASDAEDADVAAGHGGERLSTNADSGKRRSSRFSIRGMKERRSQSKQRKQQKDFENGKIARKVDGKLLQGKTSTIEDDEGNAFYGATPDEDGGPTTHGDRLNTDDEKGQRRSSRFSVRGRRPKKGDEDRSRSKQRKQKMTPDGAKTQLKPGDSDKRPRDEGGLRASDLMTEEDEFSPRDSERKRESSRLSIRQRLSRRSSRDDRPSASEPDADGKPKKHHHILCRVSGSRQRRHHPQHNDDEECNCPPDEVARESERMSEQPARVDSKHKLSKDERKADYGRSTSRQRKKEKSGNVGPAASKAYDEELEEAASYVPTKRPAPVIPGKRGAPTTLAPRAMISQPSTVTEETEFASTRPDDSESHKSKKSSKRRRQQSVNEDDEEKADETLGRRSGSRRRQKDEEVDDSEQKPPPSGKQSRHASRKERKQKQKGSRDNGYASTTTAGTGDDDTIADESVPPSETLDERRARMHRLAEKDKQKRAPLRDGNRTSALDIDETALSPKEARKLKKERSRSKRRGKSRDLSAGSDDRLEESDRPSRASSRKASKESRKQQQKQRKDERESVNDNQPSVAPSRKSSELNRKEQKKQRKEERSRSRGSIDGRSTTEGTENTSRADRQRKKPDQQRAQSISRDTSAPPQRPVRVPSIQVDATPDEGDDLEYSGRKARRDEARRGSQPATDGRKPRAESLSSKLAGDDQQRRRAESSPRPRTRDREGSFEFDDEDGRRVAKQQPAGKPSGLQRQQSERSPTTEQRGGKSSKTPSEMYSAVLRPSKSNTIERTGPSPRTDQTRVSAEAPDDDDDDGRAPSPQAVSNQRRAQSIKQQPVQQQPYVNFDNRSPQQKQQQQQVRRKTDNFIDLDEQQRRLSSSVVTQTSNTLLYDRASGGEAPFPQQQQPRSRKPSNSIVAKASYDSVMSGYTIAGTQPPQVLDPSDMTTTAEDDDRAYAVIDVPPKPAAKKSSVASTQYFREQQQQSKPPGSSRRLTAPDSTTPKSSQVTMHSVRSSLSGPVYAQTAAATVDDALERASIEASVADGRRQKSPSIPSRPVGGAASRKQSVIQQQQTRRPSVTPGAPPRQQADDAELSHVQQLADGAWRGAAGNRAFAPTSTARPAASVPPRGGDQQTSSLLQLVASQPQLHPGQQQQQFTVIQISEIIRPRVRQIIGRRLALPTVDPSSDSNMVKVVDWIANRAAHRTLLTLAEQQQKAGTSAGSPPFVQDVYRAVEQQIELAVRDMKQLLVQYRQDAAGLLENDDDDSPAQPALTAKQLKKQQKEERRSSSRQGKRSRSRANSRQRQSEDNGRRGTNSPQYQQSNNSHMQQPDMHNLQRETSEYYNMNPISDPSHVDVNSTEPLQRTATQWRKQR